MSRTSNTLKVRNIIFGKGMPKICVPVMCQSPAQTAEVLKDYEKVEGWDLVELRLDALETLDAQHVCDTLASARTITRKPILATVRTAKEGGQVELGDKAYTELVSTIIECGYADIVDIEARLSGKKMDSLVEIANDKDVVTLLSEHHFHHTPENKDMRKALEHMEDMGGDLLKLAVMPNDQGDVLRLMKCTRRMAKKLHEPIITMAMGEAGKISRVCGEITGSVMTFATIGEESAPGQMPLDTVRDFMKELHYE